MFSVYGEFDGSMSPLLGLQCGKYKYIYIGTPLVTKCYNKTQQLASQKYIYSNLGEYK